MTQIFFFLRCLPRISLVVSVTAVLKIMIIKSWFVPLLFIMVRGANFPPIIAWKVSNTFGSFSLPRSNLRLMCFGLLQAKVGDHRRGHFRWLLLVNFVFRPVLSHHTSKERQPAAASKLPNDQPHQSPKQSCWRLYWTDLCHKQRRSSLKNRQASEQEGAAQSRSSTYESSVRNISISSKTSTMSS